MGKDSVRGKAALSTGIVKRLIAFVVICLLLLVATVAIGMAFVTENGTANYLRSEVVELNELSQNDMSRTEFEAVSRAQEALRNAAGSSDEKAFGAILLVFVVAACCLIVLAFYLYRAIARPFAKLQGFAEEVASGNLDLPLEYERSNPFGKFAWAFDHMRSELKRARASELAAMEENKTVMASLAHDLRTPIASIRAYSEALSLGLGRSEEERREYASVIERRCTEVSQLVDDMLTHSLAELDRISVECSVVSVAPILRQVVEDFGLSEVTVSGIENALIRVDELRLRQAIENLLVNASKYANGTKVEVSGMPLVDGGYRITVRDFGPGMPAADIPFAFDRFYRGANAKNIQGSGLGLFVVRYVVERMGGRAMIQNAQPGIAVYLDVLMEEEEALS